VQLPVDDTVLNQVVACYLCQLNSSQVEVPADFTIRLFSWSVSSLCSACLPLLHNLPHNHAEVVMYTLFLAAG
jgi:hypothetical protein